MSIAPVILDTDVLVDFLRGQPRAVALVSRLATRIVLSTIVLAELYAGVKGDAELGALDDLTSSFPLIPITPETARAVGLFRRDFGPSHGVSLADALLAATVESEQAELKTVNVRHYPMLRGLRPAYSK
jgi:predicted nucleic acid-binding protein